MNGKPRPLRIRLIMIASALAIASCAAERAAPDGAAKPAPAACAMEVGFSPEGSASALVLRTIGSAHQSVRLAGYLFTSPDIVRALIAAKRRGVDVQAAIDERSNRGATSTAALNQLASAAIPVRIVSAYSAHHDKYMVVDEVTVQTGSFNYIPTAQRLNSENALVINACPALARQYLDHWQSRWNQGVDWPVAN